MAKQGVTIEQIGQKYDLTKERIRQIKERAIKRLQKARYRQCLEGIPGLKIAVPTMSEICGFILRKQLQSNLY